MGALQSKENRATAMMELIGTAILVFTIQSSVGLGASLAPLAIGAILIAIVFAGGPVSGAHYNPAVSLAIALRGALSSREMVTLYWLPQIVGGTLGGYLGTVATGSSSGGVQLGGGFGLVQALVAEVIFTFILCFVVLTVATNSKVGNNHYYGLAIGLVVASGAITVGPISGGAFNPAVVIGLGISNISYALEVIGSNLLGGAIAAGCFYVVVPEEFEIVPTTEPAATNEATPLA